MEDELNVTVGGSGYFWHIRLKVYRLPNFNMLFQFLWTKFSKSELLDQLQDQLLQKAYPKQEYKCGQFYLSLCLFNIQADLPVRFLTCILHHIHRDFHASTPACILLSTVFLPELVEATFVRLSPSANCLQFSLRRTRSPKVSTPRRIRHLSDIARITCGSIFSSANRLESVESPTFWRMDSILF